MREFSHRVAKIPATNLFFNLYRYSAGDRLIAKVIKQFRCDFDNSREKFHTNFNVSEKINKKPLKSTSLLTL